MWPPDFGGGDCCECSVCVTAESHNSGTLTIQQAINKVKTIGGTVCLDVGVYSLGETPVNIIDAKSLTVRGQGSATVLTFVGAGSAILMERSKDVTLERLALLTADRGQVTGPVVAVRNSSAVTMQRNAIARIGDHKTPSAAIGLGGILVGVLIRENILIAPIGVGRLTVASDATGSRNVAVLTADLVVVDNTFECTQRGISFDVVSIHAFQTRLAGNLIVGCSQAAIVMLGWVVPGSGLDVRENEINTTGSGIIIGTDDARIESNSIAGLPVGPGGDGIVLTRGFDRTGLDRCQILGNRILGLGGNGIQVVNGIIRSAMIKNNFIQVVGGGGIVMNDQSRAGQMTVENNQLLNLAPLANDAKTAVTGLRIVNTIRAEIIANVLDGVGIAAAKSPERAGIQLANVASGRVDGNEVVNLGPPGDFAGDTVGIESLGTFSQLDIASNTVRRNLATPDNPGKSKWFAVRIGSLPASGFVAVSGKLAFVVADTLVYAFLGDVLATLPRGKEVVGIQANLLEAYGVSPTVSVIANGVFTFSTNRCLLTAVSSRNQTVAQAQAGAIIANANYLEGPAKVTALLLQLVPENGPFTVLGNISSGEILINGNPLALPRAPLNVIAP